MKCCVGGMVRSVKLLFNSNMADRLHYQYSIMSERRNFWVAYKITHILICLLMLPFFSDKIYLGMWHENNKTLKHSKTFSDQILRRDPIPTVGCYIKIFHELWKRFTDFC